MQAQAPFDWADLSPPTQAWFQQTLGEPTPAQQRAWPAILGGENCLVAAPTGSGKTLAAFLAVIDQLFQQADRGELADEAVVLYISPLKALSNDIHKNLQAPLNGIADARLEAGLPTVEIKAMVRTGDTPQSDRARMRRSPPHILVTTPESLFILLGSESGRTMLSSIRHVIVDEVHALLGNKRGSHLTLSLARLQHLTGGALQRIGLSATQKPVQDVARFLCGETPCQIVDDGHVRERDLAMVVPGSPLTAVMAGEVWAEVYDRLAEMAQQHQTTLIFVNTRRLAERVTRHLGERIGEEAVAAHHGSMAKEHRLSAEQRLKGGQLTALVATASLELGIDIGDVDLVCQIGSPRGINAFLQRVGRSGHAVGATPKGRLFPTTLDEAVECIAVLAAVEQGQLDALRAAPEALDVLSQQLVAEIASQDWDEQALFAQIKSAWPYRDLTKKHFHDVLKMLAEGYTSRRGRRGAHIHWDRVNGQLRGRRGARLLALTNAGVIPDQFDYDVIMLPEGFKVGTLNEDFAFETLPGDIFQLGNQSYRVFKVDTGRLLVEDANGQPPTVPFWLGEAPGRSNELSLAVSEFRKLVSQSLEQGRDHAVKTLCQRYPLPESAAVQLVEYLGSGEAALGAMPTHDTIVFERFFDDTGDMHFVVHSTYGSRINRAWGLALRKRFCRKFNFELQAAALEDSIVLSLGVTHSFAMAEVAEYLKPASLRDVLEQALLDAPMFPTHWRWNASIALAIRRHLGDRKSPPAWQRNEAEDLMAVVFPDQIACAENLSGKREIPDHPLVTQTLHDCLFDLMDLDGLSGLIQRLQAGQIELVCAELTAPSPLAQEIINARPYAFLDDGDAEARRTMAISQGAALPLEDARSLARLDDAAIAQVREQAWPSPDNAEELHEALLIFGGFSDAEIKPWQHWADELAQQNRLARINVAQGLWMCAERLQLYLRLMPNAQFQPAIQALDCERDNALVELLRGRLEASGPVTIIQLTDLFGLSESDVSRAMLRLENEGFVVRGEFDPQLAGEQWCERRLLARIHRYTRDRKRASIKPVSQQAYQRFVHEWQGLLGERAEGLDALLAVLQQLEGFSAPTQAWEQNILPARVALYLPSELDSLCAAGKVAWARLAGSSKSAVRSTPIAFCPREHLALWRKPADAPDLSSGAQALYEILQQRGALFFSDLSQQSGLLKAQVEEALGELVAAGLASADTFAGLRGLMSPSRNPGRRGPRSKRRRPLFSGAQDAGRWALLPRFEFDEDERLEHYIWTVLGRYGVLSRRVLELETWKPAWRQLLRAAWRLEARGEIVGGRFVEGLGGEQFALPEACKALQKQGTSRQYVRLSSCDPAHLIGRLLSGHKLPSQANQSVLYQNGQLLAWTEKSEPVCSAELAQQRRQEILARLTGNPQFGQAGLRRGIKSHPA